LAQFGMGLQPAGVPGAGNFEGIVALSNCSGSLVRHSTARPSDRAWVLTNGHCLESGFLSNNQVVKNKTSNRKFSILKHDGSGNLGSVQAQKILYATMTGSDMALYELTQSFENIESAFDTKALTLATERPQAGAPIEVSSGYWKRIYRCSVAKFIPELREGQWTFTDSIKYTQPGCETIGGTSGSPIIHADTREVIGVNNTGNEDGNSCTLNNPCEVDEKGNVVIEKGAAYGQQIYQVNSCIDSDEKLDLTLAGCALFRGEVSVGELQK
jgi:V8-like Glu-specific endopeptidase